MSKTKVSEKKSRRRHAPEYRQEALALAARIGVASAARELGLAASQLYSWRSKGRERLGQSDREQQVLAENARLKRELAEAKEEAAILKKAALYFAKDPKRGTPS
jgi:transposase